MLFLVKANPCWAAVGQLGSQKQKSFQEREVRDHICFPPFLPCSYNFLFFQPLSVYDRMKQGNQLYWTESSSSPASFLIHFYALTSGKSVFKVQVHSHLESLSYVSLPSEKQNCLNISDFDHFSCFCLLCGWILQVWDSLLQHCLS